MKNIQFNNFTIGTKSKPFIIAELSGNHNGSLNKALEIVEKVADSGAQAIKLQTYSADTMTLDLKEGEFFIEEPKSLWKNRSLYELYQEAATPWEWHKPIFEKCKTLGLCCFSTPFDSTSVDFLESLNVPIYKIASFEIVDIPLIKKVASTKKPLILSTGMATIEEIALAVNTAKTNGCTDLVLLKCTSSYPASPLQSNIATIPHLRDLFRTQVGLSDHTLGIGVACAAVAQGATVIEKHVTLDRTEGGVDSAFSLEPQELKSLVEETTRAHESVGEISYGPTTAEQTSLVFRRSIYICQDVKAGDTITPQNVRCIRPGFGLEPKHYDWILGRKFNDDFKRGTALKLVYIN